MVSWLNMIFCKLNNEHWKFKMLFCLFIGDKTKMTTDDIVYILNSPLCLRKRHLCTCKKNVLGFSHLEWKFSHKFNNLHLHKWEHIFFSDFIFNKCLLVKLKYIYNIYGILELPIEKHINGISVTVYLWTVCGSMALSGAILSAIMLR